MYSNLELKILRGLAVIGLATAVTVMVMIAMDAGVIGGGSGTGNSTEAQASATPQTENQAGAGDASGQPAEAPPAAGEGEAGATPATEKTYVVEDGDSFYSISRKFNTSIADIQQLNPNLDPSNLSPGTKITVP